jgi:feruloyl esterase
MHRLNQAALLFLAALGVAHAHAATPCEGLTSIKLTGGTIAAAQTVAPGAFHTNQYLPPGSADLLAKLPPFCRVEATLTPSADSAIHLELWLPADNWNGKLVEGGNSGFSPSLNYRAMAEGLQQGYATTSSDTGHGENGAQFALGHPQKLIDFAYRAVHADAVAAKAIVKARYGSAPRKAYFIGCSSGGRQALGEAERYPADFDGLVAGDPGINTTHQTAMQTWVGQQAHQDPAAFIPPSKFAMFHAAVLAACDALDGVTDGVIENPLHCRFDPGTLLCGEGDRPDCLTAPQVELARKVYAGPVNAKGQRIFPGVLLGSEQSWGSVLAAPQPMAFAVDFYRYLVKQDPAWNYLTLDLDRDVAAADATVAALINNTDTELKPFFVRGGKLIGYHGWADGDITPYTSINFYQAVAQRMGGEAAIDNSYRLFLVPGMGHCNGGDGTSVFDMLTAIDTWVVGGKAPDSIPASRARDGKIDRTRPLCPFPKQAVYKGTGSTDDDANFICAVH